MIRLFMKSFQRLCILENVVIQNVSGLINITKKKLSSLIVIVNCLQIIQQMKRILLILVMFINVRKAQCVL